MTDKQIIKDGIDVSGCERHCSDNRNNPNMCYSEMTRTYSNCNPKEKQCNFYITSIEEQLKRKEQECEELKEDLIEAKAHGDYLNNLALSETLNLVSEQLDQLKADNEELKKCYKNNSALLDFEETNTTKLVNKVMKLEKTLTEIKEIATCCIEGDVARIRMKQILNKISEVLDEDI